MVSSYPETLGVKWPGRKKIFSFLSDTLLEGNTLVRARSNMLTDEEGSRMMKDKTSEDGRGENMMFTQTNSVREEPVRYFYFI